MTTTSIPPIPRWQEAIRSTSTTWVSTGRATFASTMSRTKGSWPSIWTPSRWCIRAASEKLPEVELGFNYPFPWNAYGRYFGRGAPPGTEPELGRWLIELDQNLAVLRGRLGMRVVRLFLLCNAWNYGAIEPSTRSSGSGSRRLRQARFVPPEEAHPAFAE